MCLKKKLNDDFTTSSNPSKFADTNEGVPRTQDTDSHPRGQNSSCPLALPTRTTNSDIMYASPTHIFFKSTLSSQLATI